MNGEPFACGRTYSGMGTTVADMEPTDLRFYVSNVRLVDAAGGETAVALDQDGTWQLEDLAMLDFEDATGRCGLTGNPQTNTSVRGELETAGGAELVALRFTLGVPFERNHGDAAAAPPPLDKSALFWNWNAGYKFLRFDGVTAQTNSELRVHVGSTRCDGDGRGHVTGCANPNRVEIELAGFDHRRDAIVLDVGRLVAGSNVETNAPGTPTGCQGSPNDSDCAAPFARLGLPFGGRQAETQQVFRVGVGLGRGPDASPAPSPSPTPVGAFAWQLPEGFPVPAVPEDNPMSDAKVELGRHLFYDTRLSLNGTQACASCHQPEKAFSDGRPASLGSTGEATPRNAPSLTNVPYNPTLTWMNPLLVHLEDQVLVPLFGEEPVELGFAGREDVLLDRLRSDAGFPGRFADAFPGESSPVTVENVAKAIAAFQRTLISGNSPYDRYIRGDDTALSASALRGMEFFFSELLECAHCHGGLNFASSLAHAGNLRDATPFENNGLFNIGGTGAYPEPNTGLFAFSGDPRDMGRMKPPTLRNIELTAPYMHDGSMATLDEVIDHYERGGRLVQSGPNAGDGALSPLKSDFLIGFPLSAQAKADVIEFLRSLTDWDFVNDPRFADPFRPTSAAGDPRR